jgi:DNA-directed RNA polymerase specialized sigma24 family protein
MKSAIPLNTTGRADRNRYATASSFQKLFATEMADFYRLAFLIVADCTKAEDCLIAAMNDCIHGSSVAEGWMRTWARRVVIRNAIRIVVEVQQDHSEASDAVRVPADLEPEGITPSVFGEFTAVLDLPNFERIVFVLCILERYCIQDCALLVGRLQQDVREAKSRALDQIAMHEGGTSHWNANPTNSIYSGSANSEELGEANDFCDTLLDFD